MNDAIKILIGAASALVIGISTFAIVKHVRYKSLRNKFPSAFSDAEFKELTSLEVQIKDIVKKDKTSEKKREISFIIADVICTLKDKERKEGRDLSKAVKRMNELADSLNIDIKGALKIVEQLHKNMNDMLFSDLLKNIEK